MLRGRGHCRTRGDGAARRVDVHCDGLLGAVGLEPEELGYDGCGDGVVDGAVEADDALLEGGRGRSADATRRTRRWTRRGRTWRSLEKMSSWSSRQPWGSEGGRPGSRTCPPAARLPRALASLLVAPVGAWFCMHRDFCDVGHRDGGGGRRASGGGHGEAGEVGERAGLAREAAQRPQNGSLCVHRDAVCVCWGGVD